MADFSEFIELAVELISENGRLIDLVQETPTATDPAKPWRVSTDRQVDKLIGVKAVNFDFSNYLVGANTKNYSNSGVEKDLLKRGDKTLMVAAGDPAINGANVLNYDVVTDFGEPWGIVNIEPLQVAEQPIIYTLQIRRI